MEERGERTVTLVIDGLGAAQRAHALVERVCDATWLASARRAELCAAVARDAPPRTAWRRDVSPTLVAGARRVLHARVEGVDALVRRARDGALTTPAYRVERHGAALRIAIDGALAPADAALVASLQAFGTGELFAGAWVVESGTPLVGADVTASW
jgi:hypothetical protein